MRRAAPPVAAAAALLCRRAPAGARFASTAAAAAASAPAPAYVSPLAALPARQTARAVQRMGVRAGAKVAVVLREQLDNLGHRGEEVRVAPGYARNFLVPAGKAVYATDSNRGRFKVVLPPEEARAIAQQREVNMLRARIATFRLRFTRATKDGVHLYGSVTAADIVEGLKASVLRKLDIRERNVRLGGAPQPEPLPAVASSADGGSGAAAAAGGPLPTAGSGSSDAGHAQAGAIDDAAAEEDTAEPSAAAPPTAQAPAAAPAPLAASPGSGGTTIKTVGEHTIVIEPRPGLWCPLTVVVESS